MHGSKEIKAALAWTPSEASDPVEAPVTTRYPDGPIESIVMYPCWGHVVGAAGVEVVVVVVIVAVVESEDDESLLGAELAGSDELEVVTEMLESSLKAALVGVAESVEALVNR